MNYKEKINVLASEKTGLEVGNQKVYQFLEARRLGGPALGSVYPLFFFFLGPLNINSFSYQLCSI